MSEIGMDATPDGVEDQIGEDLRLTLLVATQGAQRMMQVWNDRSREREQMEREQAQRFQAELEAHKAMAQAATRDAGSEQWWQRASPAQIAAAYAAAQVWESRDPQLASTAEQLREGLADRYGIADPDQMSVQDLVHASKDNRAAQVAGPLAHAEWEGRQYGSYADELGRQRAGIEAQLAAATSSEGQPRQFVAGADGTTVHERPEWLHHRAAAIGDLEDQARQSRRQSEDRADRLRGQGATTQSEQEWSKKWDTPERREALRERLRTAGVPADAAAGRLLTDRAMGRSPRAAVAPRREGVDEAYAPPARRQLQPRQATPRR